MTYQAPYSVQQDHTIGTLFAPANGNSKKPDQATDMSASEIKAHCDDKLISFVKALARAQALQHHKKEVLQ